jgi:hypothetical protein
VTRERPAARHELPEIDEAALAAARAADAILGAARSLSATGSAAAERWARYLAPLPDGLRDDPVPGLRAAARRARAAYGPKDSVRDTLPDAVTEPFLAAIDRLLKELARHDAHR